jgi:inhibitor of cysteine peptidase
MEGGKMKRRASKSFVIRMGILALAAALAALIATSCSSGSTVDTSAPDTTVTSVDNSTTADTATHSTATDASADAAAAKLALTEADNGKSYTVKVGDTISVVLAGNPTTGYLWESAMAEEVSPLLTLNGGEATYTPDNVGTNVVGSGGKYTFIFTAAAAGQVELKLKYWRSFEAQAEPLQTFGVTITIQ